MLDLDLHVPNWGQNEWVIYFNRQKYTMTINLDVTAMNLYQFMQPGKKAIYLSRHNVLVYFILWNDFINSHLH